MIALFTLVIVSIWRSTKLPSHKQVGIVFGRPRSHARVHGRSTDRGVRMAGQTSCAGHLEESGGHCWVFCQDKIYSRPKSCLCVLFALLCFFVFVNEQRAFLHVPTWQESKGHRFGAAWMTYTAHKEEIANGKDSKDVWKTRYVCEPKASVPLLLPNFNGKVGFSLFTFHLVCLGCFISLGDILSWLMTCKKEFRTTHVDLYLMSSTPTWRCIGLQQHLRTRWEREKRSG